MPQSEPTTQEQAQLDDDLLDQQVCALLEDERDFMANAANFAAFIYHTLPQVNWAGFYFPEPGGLILGPFGGKPACTRLPKGRGVCGLAFENAKTMIVDDVNAFDDHIVCDAASRSEMVVPLLHDAYIYGVFDIDSPVLARFTERDRALVERLIERFVQFTPIPDRYRVQRSGATRVNERIDVQTCRDHHVVLLFLAGDIGKAETPLNKIPSLFQRFRNVLLAHLKLEDDWLYPRLSQSDNAIVRGKAERYRREMGGLREQFTQLWSRWSGEGAIESDADAWRSEWERFATALLKRVEAEDRDLYLAAEANIS